MQNLKSLIKLKDTLGYNWITNKQRVQAWVSFKKDAPINCSLSDRIDGLQDAMLELKASRD